MMVRSDDFEHGGSIPTRFTCDGEDVSPHLAWEGAPRGVASFALIVDDPDAPMGTWVHWLVCDIPADVLEIPRGTVPEGARQVMNDFGRLHYGGPCPPSGTHRYYFKLYALRVEVLPTISENNFYNLVKLNSLDDAVLMGTYARARR
ncbi:MAG: YbhB/YbcL family Raf kinase inhibitor-like protein [Thermoplasmata archaeon]|nr:YbhB/YbcL family Raf kinase inhibitor-like protein [Thermoplasmata archaeon]